MEEPLMNLGREVARAQDEQLAGADTLEAARRGFLNAAAHPAPRLSLSRAVLLAGTAAAASALAFFAMVLWPRAIEIEPGDARLATSADFFAAHAEPLPLRFSEGSAVELSPNASLRVLSRTVHGVTLSLERGRLAAAVVHRKDTDWRLRAGPFEVRVTGTRFDLDWRAEQGALGLTRLIGSVVVTGCEEGQRLALTTGQALEATCRDGHLQVSITRPTLPVPPPPMPVPPPVDIVYPSSPGDASVPDQAAPPPPAPSRSPGAAAPQQGWKELAQQARYQEAWAAARAAGLSPILANESAADLLILASSARYAREGLGAQQVLLSLRERFPGSPEAAVAAFDLGKLSFDELADFAGAERWFAVVLEEQPDGPLAQDALGRLMEGRVRQGNRAGAEDAARRYLEKFPGGPQAGLARSLSAK